MTTTSTECVLCNHRPAVKVTLRSHVGVVAHVRLATHRGPFCRDCGLTLFRNLTSTTLSSGWWSPFSIFVSPIVLLLNLIGRARLAALSPPVGDSPWIAPNQRPLPRAKPVLARPLSWVGPVVLTALATGFLLYTPGPGTDLSRKNCVQVNTFGDKLVECDTPHHFKVVDVVSDWSKCPPQSQGHREILTKFYCVVEDRQP